MSPEIAELNASLLSLKATIDKYKEDMELMNESHLSDHDWLRQRIKAEEERKKMYRSITRSAISWSIPFLLTGIAVWLQTGHWPRL